MERWYNLYLECVVEFISGTIWARCFNFVKLLIINSVSLIVIGLVTQTIYSSLSFEFFKKLVHFIYNIKLSVKWFIVFIPLFF